MSKRFAIAVPVLAVVLIAASCDGSSDTTTTTTPTTTTTSSTTTTTTTSPVVAPSHRPAPDQVSGVVVGTGGGSEEMMVAWDPITSAGITSYEVYYSETLGGPYGHLATVDAADTSHLDFPRSEAAAKPGNCYKVSAIDDGGHEGPKSAAACFQPSFFPAEAGGVHGATQWGVYMATDDDPDYSAVSATVIDRLTNDLGYSQFAFGVSLGCDHDSATALGKAPDTIAVAIYFETESDANAFATAYFYQYGDMPVGIVQVTTGCLD